MMFGARKKGVVITDQRVRLTTEVCIKNFLVCLCLTLVLTFCQVLSGIRLIKYYAWESFYVHQISTLRERELRTVRGLA